jgi:hypothetical protein
MITVPKARINIEARREKDKNKEAARLERIKRSCRIDWIECGEILTHNLHNQYGDANRG